MCSIGGFLVGDALQIMVDDDAGNFWCSDRIYPKPCPGTNPCTRIIQVSDFPPKHDDGNLPVAQLIAPIVNPAIIILT
jgi:hypothetical protein